jgi:hypothetical protein
MDLASRSELSSATKMPINENRAGMFPGMKVKRKKRKPLQDLEGLL